MQTTAGTALTILCVTAGLVCVALGVVWLVMAPIAGGVAGGFLGAMGLVTLVVGVLLVRYPGQRRRRQQAEVEARAQEQADEAARTEALEQAAAQARAEAQLAEDLRLGQAALDAVDNVLDDVLAQHGQTLVVQRRKLISTDVYGSVLRDRWDGELGYFRETVVERAFRTTLDPGTLELATVYLFSICNEPTREEFQWAEVYFPHYVEARLEAAVEEQDAMAPSTGSMAEAEDATELTPQEYEQLCADLLTAGGWEARVVAGPGDQGVDVVARRDGVTAVFQCKLYSSPLGNKPVQEIHTGRTFYDADTAAVVSNADYTQGARTAARQTGVLLLHHSELSTFLDEASAGPGAT